MSDVPQRIEELQETASGLPHGPAKVALLEEAVELADSIHDVDLGFWLRGELMSAADFSGRADIMLVAFSWSLAQFDREPDRFDAYELLWKYKWVAENARKFPQISRSKLDELLVDMERRYREHGASMYSVELERRQLMLHFGDHDAARAAHAAFRDCERDALADCTACVASKNVDYYAAQRQWKRCLQAAQPVLTGRLSCAEQPHVILATVLLPLVYEDRLEEAKARQVEGYRLVGRAAQFVREHAAHLRFLVLAGDMAKAKRVLERHLPGALQARMLDDRFEFFLAARLWCDRLVARGTNTIKVRLPDGLPPADAAGKSDLRLCSDWFTSEAQAIARQFDARNAAATFRQQLDELPELLRLAAE